MPQDHASDELRGIPGYEGAPYDPAEQKRILYYARDERGGVEGVEITAVPQGETPPPNYGFTYERTVRLEGSDQSWDVYVRPKPIEFDDEVVEGSPGTQGRQREPQDGQVGSDEAEDPASTSETGIPGVDASKDIDENFSDRAAPDGICAECIGRGFLRGAAVGYGIALVLSLLSGAALWIVVGSLILLGLKGIYDLSQNWDNMSSHEKQEVAAEIVGGLVGGRLGLRRPPSSRGPSTPRPKNRGSGRVRGRRTRPNSKDDPETIRSLNRENDAADALARHGYEVEQNPRVPGNKNPDYRVDGEIFDAYSPRTNNARSIWNTVKNKVSSGQTERVVINLKDSGVELAALRQQFAEYPIQGLKNVIIIFKDGSVGGL